MKTAVGASGGDFPEWIVNRLTELTGASHSEVIGALLVANHDPKQAIEILKEMGYEAQGEWQEMEITAAMVKQLRDETDAPMMECKVALTEAGGDMTKAKALLREKGKAAAAKRADRTTAAGVVAMSTSADGKTVGAVVLESETDFVSKNPEFVAIAQKIADIFLANDPGSDPTSVAGVKDLAESGVALFRENVRVAKAVRITSANSIATYVHHDNTKGSIITFSAGDGSDEAVRKVAVHATAFPPEVIRKDQLSQDRLNAELAIEKQRALNEGKAEQMAENIAKGRVNKEFVKSAVLLEQPFYMDTARSVSQYLEQEGKGATIDGFVYLAVGQN